MPPNPNHRLLLRTGAVLVTLALVIWALRSPLPAPTQPDSRPSSSEEASRAPDTLATSSDDSAASAQRGLRVPVADVDTGQLRDTYDAPRSGGRAHQAIDIMAPAGTPVLAATGGTIARIHTSKHGGRSIYQYGPDSAWVYFYAHLDRYADSLAANDTVQRGQRIGYVGDTGNAPEGVHHLHFAVWAFTDSAAFWHGPSVNPYPLLMEGRRPTR